MARRTNKVGLLEQFGDEIDNFGRLYLIILFVSGAIWAFIAINNFNEPELFKIALIYSILLIFGFLGVSFDRRENKLGLDSRIWERMNINQKLLLGIFFFAGWYLLFMRSNLSLATAQTVGGGALFSVNPQLNYILVTVLGPLAENIFFFGVLNITLITFLRQMAKSRMKGLVMGLLIFSSYYLFQNVPNALFILGAAGLIMIITAATQNKFLLKWGPVATSALFVGGAVFPRFHSYAYQLNERHYLAASYFGIAMCFVAAWIGMLPVDMTHIANNMVAVDTSNITAYLLLGLGGVYIVYSRIVKR